MVNGVPDGFSTDPDKVQALMADILVALSEDSRSLPGMMESATAERLASAGARQTAAISTQQQAQSLVDSLLQSSNSEFASRGKRIIAMITPDDLSRNSNRQIPMAYYNGYSSGGGFLSQMPPVTKNIVLINLFMFVATLINQDFMIGTFALFFPTSPLFRWWQPVTHMFMHGGFWHIFFNMYTLVMFGMVLERAIGSKKFLTFYAITGLGAAALFTLVQWIEAASWMNAASSAAAASTTRCSAPRCSALPARSTAS